jgi:diadenylate cyclase
MNVSFENLIYYLISAIDIIIVTVIFYKVITFIRGTRAIQLLKGLIVLLVIWAVSIYLNFKTLEWIMSQAFTYGVFALVIIFQPELRRALEKLGSNRLFSITSLSGSEGTEVVIKETIHAVQHLAKRRIGALIVFEIETRITDLVESGVGLQSEISSELLINIFMPGAPLHDGAVVIIKDKIAAAGCYLPLTENSFLMKELGTRHRAGIGVTEVSDAVSIMVSEERGEISFAQFGEIKRDLTEFELEIFLMKALKPVKKTGISFWGRKVKDNQV